MAARSIARVPRAALVAAWTLLGFIGTLLAFIVYMSFIPGLPTDGGWTLANWANLAAPDFVQRVLPNTLVLGCGAVCIANAFGLPIAWLLNRTNVPFRRGFTILMAMVLVVPGYIASMGWIMLVDPQIGVLNVALGALAHVPSVPLTVSNNIWGITWVIGLMLVPAVFFLVAGPMRALDPALAEASRMSGASPWGTFLRVDAPLLWPAVLGAVIYTFISSVSIFDVPALLGGGTGKVPVLATALFYAVRPGGPQTQSFAYGVAGVYGLVLAIPCLAALWFYLRLLDRAERFAVVGGKSYRPRDVRLGVARWLGIAFVVAYLAMALLLPFLVLVWASLLPVLQAPSLALVSRLSLANYQNLVQTIGGPAVLINTALLVVSVAILVPAFSVTLSWIVVRTRLRQRKPIDVLSMLPHAIPGLAFAFALSMLGILAGRFLPWLPLSGTLVLVVVADLIQRIPYGTRLANASLAQVHRELEEAAQMSGAAPWQTMRRVLFPLIRPGVVYLGIWTALLTLQEVSMALFLSGPQNVVLSVSIFQLWTDGSLGPAAAGSVVLMLVLSVVTALVLKLTGAANPGVAR